MSGWEPTRIPAEGLETPYGTLYRPLSEGRQLLVVLTAFLASLGVGGLVALVAGDLSDAARVVLHFWFVLVFFVGYATWVARLSAIAFDGLGRSLLVALWNLLVHRRKPASPADVLPSRDKLLEMAVRAQQAGGSFWRVSWSIAALAALVALFFDTQLGSRTLALIVFGSVLTWGWLLGRLGSRGWLPFPEEE